MLLFELLIIFFLFAIALLLINYYISLVRSKETYSRSEIINPLPIFNILKNQIADRYPVFQFTMTLAISAFAGIIVAQINYWFTNTAVIPAIMFFGFPLVKKFFDEQRVLEYSTYGDMLKNVFIRMNEIIFYAYSFGAAASIIHTWGALRGISFLYFIVNISVIAVLITITIQNNIKDKE